MIRVRRGEETQSVTSEILGAVGASFSGRLPRTDRRRDNTAKPVAKYLAVNFYVLVDNFKCRKKAVNVAWQKLIIAGVGG